MSYSRPWCYLAYISQRKKTQFDTRQKAAACSCNTSSSYKPGWARRESPRLSTSIWAETSQMVASAYCRHTALQEAMLLGEIFGEWATCTALSKASEQTVPPHSDQSAWPGSASPSLSEETAAHTTRSPVLMWETARSVFNGGIKQVYIPQRTREWHSFCLQMIICSFKNNKIKKEPTPK